MFLVLGTYNFGTLYSEYVLLESYIIFKLQFDKLEQMPKMVAFQVSTFLPCGKIAESGSFPTFESYYYTSRVAPSPHGD